jgi:hypothetical protein
MDSILLEFFLRFSEVYTIHATIWSFKGRLAKTGKENGNM